MSESRSMSTRTLALQLQLVLAHFSDSFNSVAWAPDGKLLASGSQDRTVRLWDVASGQLQHTLEGHMGAVLSVAWAPDGHTLASGSQDRTVRLWDVASGQLQHTLEGPTSWVRSVVWAPDGHTLASGSDDRTVRLWDVASGQLQHTLEGHTDGVRSVAWAPDGHTLASGARDGTVRLWDVASGQLQHTLEGHTDGVRSVAWAPDGHTLASGTRDGTVRLWDVASGQLQHTLEGHTDGVRSVAWAPDGHTLASGSDDRTVRLWDVASGQLQHTLEGPTSWVWSVAWAPDGHTLASGSQDGTVRLWDVASGQLQHTLEGHTDAVWSVAWAPDGHTLASGSQDGTVRLWDVASGQLQHTLEGHTDAVWSVAWAPDGHTLASGASDGTVRLWDVASGQLQHTLEGHTNAVWSVAWAPDGHTLASGASDGTVRLWDVASGQFQHTLEGSTNLVLSVAWAPDGHTLASGAYDGTVRLWDVASGQLQRTLEGHTDGVWSVAWAPDGHTLASGSQDGMVRLWDVASGQLQRTLEGHTDGVWSVAWAPDGHTLASGADDGTVRLWNSETGEELCVYVSAQLSHSVRLISFPSAVITVDILSKTCLGDPDLIIQTPLWETSAPALAGAAIRYISAKIVLVGESNVGKSCLALRLAQNRYEEQGTTHGMHLWPMQPEELHAEMAALPGEQREVVLWDLGGQSEYRLVHQLFLRDTTLALILLDPTRDTAFEDAVEWNLRLEKQLRGQPAVKLLVGTKEDQYRADLTYQARIDALLQSCGFDGFYATSALANTGMDTLRAAIARKIDWQALSQTTRPRFFQRIREAIEHRRATGEVVLLYAELLQHMRNLEPEDFQSEAVHTVVRQLAQQGVLVDTNLATGERALVLQISYIESYAGSLIRLARDNRHGVPVLEVSDAIFRTSFPGISEEERLKPLQERSVLECVIQLLLEHGICLKHEGLLIFPALFPPTAAVNDTDSTHTVSLYYDFSGAIGNIYSSLVVHLAHSGRFGRVRLWKDQAVFEHSGQEVCGLRKIDRGSGLAHLDLFFSAQTSPATRDLFTIFVEEHLHKEGVTIKEVLEMVCGTCGYRFDEALVRDRIHDGHADVLCPRCETRLLISEGAKKARESNPALAAELIALKQVIDQRKQEDIREVKRTVDVRSAAASSPQPAPIRILHLSDLHFGPDDDPAVRLQPLVRDLQDREGGLGFEHLDYLVVSGDLTNRASKEEFDRVYTFIAALNKCMEITPIRCVIIPGNHDLSWDVEVYDWRPSRRVDVGKLKTDSYIKKDDIFLVRDEAKYPVRFENFGKFYHELMQKPYPLKAEEQSLALLFEEAGIQFLALNSAWEIDEYFPARSSIHPGALATGLSTASAQIKAARATGQLAQDAHVLRLAVWHHPVTGNEKIVNDAFLDQLRQENFALCLHGHVHEDRADVVGYVHPRKLRIAGAGSFGAPTSDRPEATPRLYNVLEVWRDHSKIRIHTRSLRRDGGAWDGWAVWPDTANRHGRLTYYDLPLTSVAK